MKNKDLPVSVVIGPNAVAPKTANGRANTNAKNNTGVFMIVDNISFTLKCQMIANKLYAVFIPPRQRYIQLFKLHVLLVWIGYIKCMFMLNK